MNYGTQRAGGAIFKRHKKLEGAKSSGSGESGALCELRSEMTRLVGTLSGEFKKEMGRYERLKKTVNNRQKELEDICELQKQAADLLKMINLHRRRRQIFEKELQARMMALESIIHKNYASLNAETCIYDEAEKNGTLFKKQVQGHKSEKSISPEISEQLKNSQGFEKIRAKDFNTEFGGNEELSDLDAIIEETFEKFAITSQAHQDALQKEFADKKNILNIRIQSLEQKVEELSGQLNRLVDRQSFGPGNVQRA